MNLIILLTAWSLTLGCIGTAAEKPKITSSFFCISSGNLERKELDDRKECAVFAVSAFHEKYGRFPTQMGELREFCRAEQIDLMDLIQLESVSTANGQLEYSAAFKNGTLHLKHIPFHFFRSDQIKPFEFK